MSFLAANNDPTRKEKKKSLLNCKEDLLTDFSCSDLIVEAIFIEWKYFLKTVCLLSFETKDQSEGFIAYNNIQFLYQMLK